MPTVLPTRTLRRFGQAWIDTHQYSVAEDLEFIRSFFDLGKVADEMFAITQVRSAASLSDLYKTENSRRPKSVEHIALVATLLREYSDLMRAETGQAEPASRDTMRRWLRTGEIQTVDGPTNPLHVLSSTPLTIAALNDVRASAIGE